jgi:small subunit ribosomal protein S1
MRNLSLEDNTLRPLKVSEIVEGKIIGIGSSGLFVDLSPFGTGIIYKKEFYGADERHGNFKIGDKIFTKIIGPENEEGYFELSLKRAGEELTWKKLEELKEKNEIIKVVVSKANRGGLIVEIDEVSGFLPVSQLSAEHYPLVRPADESRTHIEGGENIKILWELQKLIGKNLEVKILDLDSREKKLILSEKAKDAQNLKEILKNYKVNDAVEGKITGITDFGIFLTFGPEKLEGLIHISEIDQKKASDLSEIFKIGQAVKAKIIKIAENRVYLSLKDVGKTKSS